MSDDKVTKIKEFEVKPSANTVIAIVEAFVGKKAKGGSDIIFRANDYYVPLSLQAAKALHATLGEAIDWIELEQEKL